MLLTGKRSWFFPWSTGKSSENADSGPPGDRAPAGKSLIIRHSAEQIP
jgi:hypothetical protein